MRCEERGVRRGEERSRHGMSGEDDASSRSSCRHLFPSGFGMGTKMRGDEMRTVANGGLWKERKWTKEDEERKGKRKRHRGIIKQGHGYILQGCFCIERWRDAIDNRTFSFQLLSFFFLFFGKRLSILCKRLSILLSFSLHSSFGVWIEPPLNSISSICLYYFLSIPIVSLPFATLPSSSLPSSLRFAVPLPLPFLSLLFLSSLYSILFIMDSASPPSESAYLLRLKKSVTQQWQVLLDRSVPHLAARFDIHIHINITCIHINIQTHVTWQTTSHCPYFNARMSSPSSFANTIVSYHVWSQNSSRIVSNCIHLLHPLISFHCISLHFICIGVMIEFDHVSSSSPLIRITLTLSIHVFTLICTSPLPPRHPLFFLFLIFFFFLLSMQLVVSILPRCWLWCSCVQCVGFLYRHIRFGHLPVEFVDRFLVAIGGGQRWSRAASQRSGRVQALHSKTAGIQILVSTDANTT